MKKRGHEFEEGQGRLIRESLMEEEGGNDAIIISKNKFKN